MASSIFIPRKRFDGVKQVAFGTSDDTANPTVVTVPTPEKIMPGDLMLLLMSSDNAAVSYDTLTNGWVEMRTNAYGDPITMNTICGYKISKGNEPATYSFGLGGATMVMHSMVVLRTTGQWDIAKHTNEEALKRFVLTLRPVATGGKQTSLASESYTPKAGDVIVTWHVHDSGSTLDSWDGPGHELLEYKTYGIGSYGVATFINKNAGLNRSRSVNVEWGGAADECIAWSVLVRANPVPAPINIGGTQQRSSIFIPRKITRTKVPEGSAAIDWANPLSRGLDFAVFVNPKNPKELVHGGMATSWDGSKVKAASHGTREGYAYVTNNEAPAANALRFPWPKRQYNAMTFVLLGGLTARSANYAAFVGEDYDTNFLLQMQTVAADDFRWVIHGPGWNQSKGLFSGTAWSPLARNWSRSIAGRWDKDQDSGGSWGYVDGQLAITGNTSTTICDRTQDSALNYLIVGGDSSFNQTSQIFGLLIWDRRLSEQELRAIDANPYQILEPQSAPIQISDTQQRSSIFIPRKIVRTSNPNKVAGIDWSNPLTKDLLTGNIALGNGLFMDLTGQGQTRHYTTATVTKEGMGITGSGTEVTTPSSPVTSVGDRTLLAVVVPFNTNNAGRNYYFDDATLGRCEIFAFQNHWQFQAHHWSNYMVSTGWNSATAPKIGQSTVAIGRARLSDNLIQVDVRPMRKGIAPEHAESTSGTVLSIDYNSSTNIGHIYVNPDNADTVLGLLWNRSLSDSEVTELLINPWQIFEPISAPINIGYDIAAAAGGLPAAVAHHHRHINIHAG